MFRCLLLLVALASAEQAFAARRWLLAGVEPLLEDNSEIPSWIPGYPGIDQGTIHFTYGKDLLEVLLLLILGWRLGWRKDDIKLYCMI